MLGLVITAAAAPLNYAINWWNAGSGGGASIGGSYSVYSTIGQPASGAYSGGDYILTGGFTQSRSSTSIMYLPIIIR